MNEQTTTEIFQPALFPLSAVQTSGYASPDQDDTEAVADNETPQPVEDAA